MTGRVLLGVSDGLVRMAVADAAADVAARTGRALRVVHVHAGPHTVWDGDAGVRTEAYLRRTAPGLPVDRLCRAGGPSDELLDGARAGDLLVLGDRRTRLGERAGRTTEEVLTGTSCPVLVVPEYRVPAGGGARRGGVVAVLDGGPADEAVLEAAAGAVGAGPTPLEVLDAAGARDQTVEQLVARVPAAPTTIAVRATSAPVDEASRGAALVVVALPPDPAADGAGHRLLTRPPCPVLLVPVAPPGAWRTRVGATGAAGAPD